MRRTRLAELGIAPLVLLAPLSLQAAIYYVAPAGNDANPGTLAQPFASFARAQTAAAAGDTVYFRGGTYSYTAGTSRCSSGTATISGVVLSKSGTAAARIKYWAYDGEKPVFDFAGIKDSCRVKGLLVSGSGIHLKGMEIKGVPQNNTLNHESWGVWISGSNNIFEQLDVHHIMGAGVFIQSGGGNLVLNCDSHQNYDPMTSNGAGQSGDGFGAHIDSSGTGNVFRGCRAWWNSDDGYDLINAFAPVLIENSWAWYHGYMPGTMTSLAAGNGNGFKAGGYGTDTSTFPSGAVKHTVRNCLSVGNKAAGFYSNHHPDSGFFYNNTGYNNNPSFDMLGMSRSGADITVGVYRNNVAVGTKLLSSNAGADNAGNSWTLPVTVTDSDFQSVAVTGLDGPRQADGSLPNLPNFHLVAGSDLIDKGQNLMLPTPYVGSAPDLGAFEYGAVMVSGTGGATVAGTGGGDSRATGGVSGTGGMGAGSGGAPEISSGGNSGTGGQGLLSTGGAAVSTGGQNAPGTGGSPVNLGSGGSGPGPGGTHNLTGGEVDGSCACAMGTRGGGNGASSIATSLSLLGLSLVARRRRRGR